MLLSANGGETIAGGLNQALLDSGYKTFIAPNGRKTWVGPGKWLPDHATGHLSPEEVSLPRAQRDRLLKARVMQWVRDQPAKALYLEAAKLTYMWGVYPFWNGALQTLAGNTPILIVLAGGLGAMVRFRNRWRQLVLFWSLPIFVSVVAMISWGSWRFRQPGDVGLLALCSMLAVSYLFPRALISGQQSTSADLPPKAPHVSTHRNANQRSPALYP